MSFWSTVFNFCWRAESLPVLVMVLVLAVLLFCIVLPLVRRNPVRYQTLFRAGWRMSPAA